VANQKLFEIASARNWSTAQELANREIIRSLPGVPVLSETLLLMELMVRQPCVDLTQISGLILSDVGATLQILRLAGRECNFPLNFAFRIEDCISDLGLDTCLEVMAQCTITRSNRHSALLAVWEHAREISNLCGSIARQMPGNLNSEEACVVGLCHELGALPAALGWDCPILADQDLAGLKIAQAWSLPACLVDYLSHFKRPRSSNHWHEVVERAHQLAGSAWTQFRQDEYIGADVDSWAGLRVAASWN
jgi:HD-like signal output (HDOD) protein